MKVLRTLFVFILVVVILGGVGLIAWNMYYGPNNIADILPWNTNRGTNTTDPNMQGNMSGMDMSGNDSMTPATGVNTQNNNNLSFSAISLQNRQKLMEVQNMVNDAIDLITMDPYSRVTVPSSMNGNMEMPQTQGSSGTINIYPNGTNSLNITPPVNGDGTANRADGMANMPGMPNMNANNNMNMAAGNYVYDQAKLEQLHRGIVRLAQGMMYLTQLNDDITIQASTMEANGNNYQTYMDRYSRIIKNKSKLNNAISSINQATELVNVNPYGSAGGYQYNAQYMEQMHRGIYALAQAMVLANDLNEDFTEQMVQAVTAAQYSIYNNNMGNMAGMNNNSWANILNPSSISTVFNLLLIVMIVVLIISVFGAIGHMFKVSNNKYSKKTDNTKESNV